MTYNQTGTTPCAGEAARVLCPTRQGFGERRVIGVSGNPELGDFGIERYLRSGGYSVYNAKDILTRHISRLNGARDLLTEEQLVLTSFRTVIARACVNTAVLLEVEHLQPFVDCGAVAIDFTKQAKTEEGRKVPCGIVRVNDTCPKANLEALHNILFG